MISVGTAPRESQTYILVMYCSSATSYGIRLGDRMGDFPCSRNPVSRAQRTISFAEYDELSALRKAQAWGTPMFQVGHAKYAETIARMNELEIKVHAMAHAQAMLTSSHAGVRL